MKAFCLSILLLAFCAPALQQILHIPHEQMPSHEVSPRPKWNISEVPTNFTWTNHNGKNYITMVRNHHLPQYCGGCYAFGSTTTLTDRIKIMRDAAFPDIIIAPQMALSCTPNHGCHGGNPILVYDYARKYGMTDETCSPYRAKGHENGAPCTDELKCSVCDSEGNCKVPDSYPVYYVKEFGHLRGGEAMMMLEIFHRGPIACMLESTHIWNYTGGIIKAFYEEYDFDHVAEVVGFGEDENGTPYWLAKNSWGSFWGEDGFFRVHRGNNSLGIETSCFWVIPEHNFTRRNYTNVSKEESSDEEIASNAFLAEIPTPKDSCLKLDPKYNGFTSLSGNATFLYTVKHYELPDIFDWRNVNGTNFLSWTRSENAPRYCASCWVDAATSALADRIMIKRNSTFPQIGLSVQSVINCQGGGNCTGGDPLGVYEFAYSHGIPEDSCQVYVGTENIAPNCSGVFVCGGCHPPAPRFAWSVNPNKCKAVTNFTNWKVSDYGRVHGVEHMKKAIYADGPIVCTMAITPEFEKYTTGVFSQAPVRGGRVATHVVSVVGWGPNKDGSEHWVVRNSWGSHWGEHGYFRIHMGRHNLGIENNCYWATPIVDGVDELDYYSSDFEPTDFETIDF